MTALHGWVRSCVSMNLLIFFISCSRFLLENSRDLDTAECWAEQWVCSFIVLFVKMDDYFCFWSFVVLFVNELKEYRIDSVFYGSLQCINSRNDRSILFANIP